jgi:hypothetical protein
LANRIERFSKISPGHPVNLWMITVLRPAPVTKSSKKQGYDYNLPI